MEGIEKPKNPYLALKNFIREISVGDLDKETVLAKASEYYLNFDIRSTSSREDLENIALILSKEGEEGKEKARILLAMIGIE